MHAELVMIHHDVRAGAMAVNIAIRAVFDAELMENLF